MLSEASQRAPLFTLASLQQWQEPRHHPCQGYGFAKHTGQHVTLLNNEERKKAARPPTVSIFLSSVSLPLPVPGPVFSSFLGRGVEAGGPFFLR